MGYYAIPRRMHSVVYEHTRLEQANAMPVNYTHTLSWSRCCFFFKDFLVFKAYQKCFDRLHVNILFPFPHVQVGSE